MLTDHKTGYTFRSAILRIDCTARSRVSLSIPASSNGKCSPADAPEVCSVLHFQNGNDGGWVVPMRQSQSLKRHKPVSKADDLRQRFRTAPLFGASKVCRDMGLWERPDTKRAPS